MIRLDDHQIALDRVRRFLEQKCFSSESNEGIKLPSVREVAKAVGVSNAAVYTVYRELQDAGRVVSMVGKGTFVNPGSKSQIKLQLGVVLPGAYRTELINGVCGWQDNVIGSLFAAGTEHPDVVVRCLWGEQFKEEDKMAEEISLLDGGIFQQMGEKEIAPVYRCFDKLGKPYVCINPPEPFQTVNFVSSDYYRFGLEMGQVWLESGRKQILLLGATPDRTAWIQRMAGFQRAAGKHQESLRIHYAGGQAREDGERAMSELLESGYRPDAIFAFGDLLAYGVREVLLASGFSIPGEVSIVGGTGMQAIHELGISTHVNDYAEIARSAWRMILARIHRGGAPEPACYIPIDFRPERTTRPLETTLWKQNHR